MGPSVPMINLVTSHDILNTQQNILKHFKVSLDKLYFSISFTDSEMILFNFAQSCFLDFESG